MVYWTGTGKWSFPFPFPIFPVPGKMNFSRFGKSVLSHSRFSRSVPDFPFKPNFYCLKIARIAKFFRYFFSGELAPQGLRVNMYFKSTRPTYKTTKTNLYQNKKSL